MVKQALTTKNSPPSRKIILIRHGYDTTVRIRPVAFTLAVKRNSTSAISMSSNPLHRLEGIIIMVRTHEVYLLRRHASSRIAYELRSGMC